MKKALALLSASMLLQPTLVFADANTDPACSTVCGHKLDKNEKCSCKKHKDCIGCCKKDLVVKDTAPAEPEKKDTKYAWMDNLSGTFALTSDYVFRGVSQSANLPAVQGSLTYSFPIGVYLSVWGSNVRFPGTDASVELDTIIGYGGTLFNEALAYDINAARYNYPGERHFNYNELNTLFNYRFLQFGVSYTGNVYNTHQTGIYYNGGVNWDIPPQYILNIEDVNFTALMGHWSLPRAAGNSYNDYIAGISKKFRNYTVTAQWKTTDGRQHISPYNSTEYLGTVAVDF